MRILMLLGLTLVSTSSFAISRQQFYEQQAEEGDPYAQQKVRQYQQLEQIRQQQEQQMQVRPGGSGNSCTNDADCTPDEYCRAVNYQATGLCVERQRVE